MSHKIEFFFDCSSPWTYLGFEQVISFFGESDVEIVWKPILVGGVFNTVNQAVYETRANPVPAKRNYMNKDLQDWAQFVGIEIGWPSVFPVNSVKAMRGAFYALEQGMLEPYARAVFKRYWSDLADISQDTELTYIVEEIGLEQEAYFTAINDQSYKDKLRETTDELIRRGGFGSPTLFVDDDDMYFGNDRVALIAHKLSV